MRFFQFLNPVNSPEARHAFRSGQVEPPFVYRPAAWADDELRFLDSLQPPLDHPFGLMLATAIEGARLLILALRDRTPQAFQALALHNDWFPDEELLSAARTEPYGRDLTPATVGAQGMLRALRGALNTRGLDDWSVEMDTVMSARVLVDGAKREIKVRPGSIFRRQDVPRLIVHEIEVHATRAVNGNRQPLRIFSTGLPGSLATEEGLALFAEERAGAASPGTSWRQGVVVQAVEWARHMGFRELHEHLRRESEPGLAWGVAERLKRGLADPVKPGVYAKDVVYYQGLRRVRSWVEQGGDLNLLYVGKVGLDDPVQQWLDEGLLTLQPLPRVFRAD